MLKKILLLGLTFISLTGFAQAEQCSVSSHFTPRESIQEVIHNHLLSARVSAKASLFGLTNDVLAKDLIYLHKHNVQVEVAVDKRQSQGLGSDIPDLINTNIPVYIKKTWILEHNKFVIIDDRKVIMGSWNWSISAEKQDNSIVVIQNCPEEIQKFIDTFNWIKLRDAQ